MNKEQLYVQNFLRAIRYYSAQKLTGRLRIQNQSERKWNIYYRLGRLAWVRSNHNPNRRLLRHLHQNVQKISALEELNLVEEDVNPWEYQFLAHLSTQYRLPHEQVVSILKATVIEILFDLIQQASCEELTYQYDLQNFFSPTLTLLDTNKCLESVMGQWVEWENKGLAKISPNLAPVILESLQLQEQTSANVYKNLTTVINGTRTLREMAVLMKKDLQMLTRSLLPYYRKGIIDLVEVPDLQLSAFSTFRDNLEPQNRDKSNKRILIACVDDSLQTNKVMETIVVEAGYDFMGVQEPIEALSALIKRKPDFIFMDLIMPVVNGYELCSQIRRISQFKKTPIVILTSHDGIVERLRARMSEATDFMSKPIEADKVIELVQKYIPNPVSSQSTDEWRSNKTIPLKS